VTATATGNEIEKNAVPSSGVDLVDDHGGCAATTWAKNAFTTARAGRALTRPGVFSIVTAVQSRPATRGEDKEEST
jgi:hypothetical protein